MNIPSITITTAIGTTTHICSDASIASNATITINGIPTAQVIAANSSQHFFLFSILITSNIIKRK